MLGSCLQLGCSRTQDSHSQASQRDSTIRLPRASDGTSGPSSVFRHLNSASDTMELVCYSGCEMISCFGMSLGGGRLTLWCQAARQNLTRGRERHHVQPLGFESLPTPLFTINECEHTEDLSA